MSINIDKIIKLNDLVTTAFGRKHIIVLNPDEKNENRENLQDNIVYDVATWKLPNEEICALIKQLSQNSELSNEEKLLIIYEKLCKEYIYDDNSISYLHKNDNGAYELPDWYGRDVDEEWEKNREYHNRRVCYEVARYLAKSLKELFKDDDSFNVIILWDKDLIHYFVGLTCDEYSITLDLDNFNNIKDLTRLKTGLTAEGIIILEDEQEKLKTVLDKFNEGKYKGSIKKIECEAAVKESENIVFLKNAIDILKNNHNIDSQGLYEYMKEIVDIKLGIESRKKVWKEIKGTQGEETRYIRCLVLEIDKQKYIIDVDEMLLRPFDEEELKKENRNFIPYKELVGDDVINSRCRKEERYSGR